MQRTFSESRRRIAHIGLYRRDHSYAKLWLLCQKVWRYRSSCVCCCLLYYASWFSCRQVWLMEFTDHQLYVFCCVLISINFNQTHSDYDAIHLMKNISFFVCLFCCAGMHYKHIATIFTLFCRNTDYTEFNTCKPRPVVTDQYDILNTTNMGKYLWIVIHV
jgi:hypothetical protein